MKMIRNQNLLEVHVLDSLKWKICKRKVIFKIMKDSVAFFFRIESNIYYKFAQYF